MLCLGRSGTSLHVVLVALHSHEKRGQAIDLHGIVEGENSRFLRKFSHFLGTAPCFQGCQVRQRQRVSTRKKATGSIRPADRVAAAGRRWSGSRRARRRGRLSPPAFGLGLTAHFWCRMTPGHSAARCRCSYYPYPLTFKNRGELGANVTMRRNSLISLIKFFRICPHSGGEWGGEWGGE